jgi:hypothetical protein
MPALDLSPVYARLAWARRRGDELGAVVDAWTKAALDVREKHFDDERMIRFTACVADDPPDGVDLALGEVVYQSRAALDTLVGVLRGGATETSAFLVTPDRVAFEAALLPAKGKRREGRLFGLPDWAIDLFREIQPFEPLAAHPWGVFGAEARKLHDFAIVDRHHRIVVVATVAAIGYVETDRPEETVMRELGR